MQARILRPSGEERVLSGWGDVTRDEQGRPSRILGICQSVTDWYQREEQLIDAQAQAEKQSRRLQSGLLPSLSLPDPALELRTSTGRGTSGRAWARTSSPCRWPTAPSPS